MYTQCPHCHEAFRVTAEILQQAAGRVRCGACGHVFDALDGLSEAPPGAEPPEPPRDEDASLRATLDELVVAGNVRLEDTGVEWRLVEEDEGGEPAEADDAAGSSALRWYLHEETGEPPNDALIPETRTGVAAPGEPPPELETPTLAEERYDDNTPIPGLFDDDEEEEEAGVVFAEPPRRRAEDLIEPRSAEFDERQADFAMGEPEEWTDLLEEVADVDEPAPADAPPEAPAAEPDALELDEEPTAEHPVLETPLPPHAANEAQELEDAADETFDPDGLALVEATDEPARDEPGHSRPADAAPEAGELTLVDDDAGGEPASRDEAPAPGETPLERLIDEELLRASGAGLAAPASAGSASPPPHIETIVMEGELVRSSLHGELVVPQALEDAEPPEPPAGPGKRSLRDTYIRMREALPALGDADEPRRWTGLAATVLLVLALAAQVVHAHRETLATWPLFNDTIGVLYGRLGAPITPDWDVNGWQFQSTNGSTDANDRILTISSSIANRSGRALPYPLLHVALTDRYEEVVGGGLLEPAQYLDIRSAQGMVDAGEKFNATVTIAPLAENATGFKLNVCYPLEGTDVRCATGAFRGD